MVQITLELTPNLTARNAITRQRARYLGGGPRGGGPLAGAPCGDPGAAAGGGPLLSKHFMERHDVAADKFGSRPAPSLEVPSAILSHIHLSLLVAATTRSPAAGINELPSGEEGLCWNSCGMIRSLPLDPNLKHDCFES